jgi:hypothetical protein
VGRDLCIYKFCKREEALRPAFGVRDVSFHARCCSCKADRATSSPPWTSHGRPTSFTALGAHATAAVGDDVRLAQCESIAQLRAAVRGRMGTLRPRNGESVTLWAAKHVRGQGRRASTDFPKRRQLGVARSGDAVGVPGRGTWRVRKRDCHNEVVGARASAPQAWL